MRTLIGVVASLRAAFEVFEHQFRMACAQSLTHKSLVYSNEENKELKVGIRRW